MNTNIGAEIVKLEFISKGTKVFCWRLEGKVESDGFCPHAVHIEKDKCYECPIAENYNLEDDDTPCQNCGVDDAP